MSAELRGKKGRRLRARTACLAVSLLVLSACAGSDSEQIAVGPDGAVATTAPLAVPPVLRQPGDSSPAVPTTTAPPEQRPAAEPSPTAVAATAAATAVPVVTEPPAPPATAVPVEAATSAPAASATEPPASPATAVPVEAATSAPATSVPPAADTAPAEPAPTQVPAAPSGAAIALGDFEVVNLVTRANQNISELSPSGPTVLWFWAPH